jgi:hypothetical protein
MALKQISKITLTSFEPNRALGIENFATAGFVQLGALLGHVTGTVQRRSPDGDQVFTGLSGSIEMRRLKLDGSPDEENSATSGVMFIPEAFQNPIIDALTDIVDADGKVTKPGAEAVNFAFIIGVQKAGNAAGYEWVLKPLIEASPDAYDPLAELRKALPPVFTPAGLIENKADEAKADKKKS